MQINNSDRQTECPRLASVACNASSGENQFPLSPTQWISHAFIVRLDGTYHARQFIFSLLYFLFVPCGRLSWLSVSFLLNVKYRIVSYAGARYSGFNRQMLIRRPVQLGVRPHTHMHTRLFSAVKISKVRVPFHHVHESWLNSNAWYDITSYSFSSQKGNMASVYVTASVC